jgi:hypothetical protein
MLVKRLLASTFLLAMAACRDDGGDDCVGHLCGSDVQLTDPDGGNILFEYIYFDTQLQAAFKLPAGITTANRVMAYFVNHKTPDNDPFPEPGKCLNFDASKGWPMFTGTTHEDLDVGTLSMTGKNKAGQDVTIDVPKMPAGLDSIGRRHDIFYQTIQPDADKNIQFNSSYTINFGGAGAIPAYSITDGLFMSAGFTVKNPGFEDDGPISASADYTVEWTPAVSSNLPMGNVVLGITWLVDTNGSPTHMCPVMHESGTFTIPAATIAEYRAVATARGTDPNHVILLRNAVVHRLARLPNSEANNLRRLDMLTVNCWAQFMNCTP